MIVNKKEFIKSFLNDDITKKASNLNIRKNDDKIEIVNYSTIIAYKKNK